MPISSDRVRTAAGRQAAGAVTRPARAGTVRQGDRDKAFRPIPRMERRAALHAALEAWRRGDWFETHELLEPAWMGTADALERDLYQGLIKLAAAYVHRERGNAMGMAKNLRGAHPRIRRVVAEDPVFEGIDLQGLLADLEVRLPTENQPADLTIEPPHLMTLESARRSSAGGSAEED